MGIVLHKVVNVTTATMAKTAVSVQLFLIKYIYLFFFKTVIIMQLVMETVFVARMASANVKLVLASIARFLTAFLAVR